MFTNNTFRDIKNIKMWVDVNERERQNYLSQSHGSLIPGYTGHCPMLKFRFGKCYGDNTRHIIREIRDKGLFKKPVLYRPDYEAEINPLSQRTDVHFPDHLDDIQCKGRNYITGYTGYVPGLSFRYGKSYGRAVDDSINEFRENQRVMRKRTDINKSYTRSRSAPKVQSIHTRDEVKRSLQEFEEINKYRDHPISAEFPPIAGYTGHIPRMKGSEVSLSQRYHCAAKKGLEMIQLEREERNRLPNADKRIKTILKEVDNKYSYVNWG